MVRDHGFGVWKVWEEIAREDNSFLFEFGFGLGVWKKQPVASNDSPFIRDLFRADEAERRCINESYANAAAALALWENLARQFAPKKQNSPFTIEAEGRTTEIAWFQREAETQAMQVAQAQGDLEEKAQHIVRLQSEIEENRKRLAQIQHEAEDKSKQVAQLRREAEHESKQMAQLRRDVEEKSREASNFERDAGKTLEQVSELRQENAELRRDRDKHAQSMELIKSRLAETEERLEQASREVLEAQWQALTLRGDLSRQSESDLASARIVQLESRVAAVESERDHLRAMVSALQKDIDLERSGVGKAAADSPTEAEIGSNPLPNRHDGQPMRTSHHA
jgi:predicted  nucleic acid-binding Zn-ribbon protein